MKQILFLALMVTGLFSACKEDSAPVSSQSTLPFDQNQETETIIAVIDNETACFFARDYECWKAHYAHVDYAFQAWNNMDGTFNASIGWPAINESAGKYIKENPVPIDGSSHPRVEKRNMKLKFFNPTLVYVSWDQYNINPEMNAFTHSVENRFMEKVGMTWKIFNVTSYWDYINLVPVDSLK